MGVQLPKEIELEDRFENKWAHRWLKEVAFLKQMMEAGDGTIPTV